MNYNLSKSSTLSLEEKLEVLDICSTGILEMILEDLKSYPEEYEKEVEIAVYNKLFEYGYTNI